MGPDVAGLVVPREQAAKDLPRAGLACSVAFQDEAVHQLAVRSPSRELQQGQHPDAYLLSCRCGGRSSYARRRLLLGFLALPRRLTGALCTSATSWLAAMRQQVSCEA